MLDVNIFILTPNSDMWLNEGSIHVKRWSQKGLSTKKGNFANGCNDILIYRSSFTITRRSALKAILVISGAYLPNWFRGVHCLQPDWEPRRVSKWLDLETRFAASIYPEVLVMLVLVGYGRVLPMPFGARPVGSQRCRQAENLLETANFPWPRWFSRTWISSSFFTRQSQYWITQNSSV